MDKYIEREVAINRIRKVANMMGFENPAVAIDCTISVLENTPAADVAPVRHEKWEVIVGSDGKEHMVCTGCRKQQGLTGVFTYCPNCGAKMDLED